ncbi:hypothetical protein QDR37_14750 [Amnibacterium sp. CER49]|uniref:hypothetical protein n=1 Tax=Amnibacterium sp. CER49 TaxID=3039161 RepID=UPI002446A8DD|nr:hypothetical protein [Amnibacterium sp. CER49]MDH2445209.1 hypothetical protein [Amnibacterium sp. CER49]
MTALPDGSDALARAEDDPEGFLTRLGAAARRALGPAAGSLELEAERSIGDRLTGRPGRPVALRLTGDGFTLTLRRDGSRWAGEAARVVGGVVIAREPLQLGEWLDVFAQQVARAAADAAGDAEAAGRALGALGLQPAQPEFLVDPGDLERGLRSLPARAAGRVPSEAIPHIERIAALLLEAAPRVTGEAAALVRRTATVYLPDTLRAFVALPADWAADHTLLDGATPAAALLAQLADLEAAAVRMRDAAVEDDAAALLLNGTFLQQRFSAGS